MTPRAVIWGDRGDTFASDVSHAAAARTVPSLRPHQDHLMWPRVYDWRHPGVEDCSWYWWYSRMSGGCSHTHTCEEELPGMCWRSITEYSILIHTLSHRQLLRALSGIIHAGVEADPSQIHARVTRQDWWTHPPSSDFHSPIHQELVESWGVSRSSVSISSTRSMGGVVPGDPWGPGNSFIRWGVRTGLEQGGWKHWSWNVTNNSRDCHQFGTDLALSWWRVTDLNVTHCHYLDHRVIKTPQSGRPIRVESGSQLVIRWFNGPRSTSTFKWRRKLWNQVFCLLSSFARQ